MKIGFIQSGGLLGTIRRCTLDTTALPQEVAQELDRLVRESKIPASGEYLSEKGRDLYQYEITIDDDKHQVSVTFDDGTIPQSAKPLLGFLKKHSKPATH